MQFQLVKSHRYWWPVNIRIPDPDNAGKVIKQTLKIKFQAQDRDTRVAAAVIYRGLTDPKDISDHEKTLLTDVCKNWADVVDVEKAPVPFSDDNFSGALQQDWFRNAVFAAWWSLIFNGCPNNPHMNIIEPLTYISGACSLSVLSGNQWGADHD